MTELAPIESGPLTLFGWAHPRDVVRCATEIADEIAPIIRAKQLFKRIGQSEHVYLEGWTLAGTMLGVFPITVSSGPLLDTDGQEIGYEATVEARTLQGGLVGRADAQCTRDENDKWGNAPSFQRRSMAITRASSKALKMPLGFVMKLAGYDATPAEEMEAAAARGETVSGGRGVAPGWRNKAEQDNAHQRLNLFAANNGLGEWIATWLDSKGYTRPLSKAQMNQLRRDVDRELEERKTDSPASAVDEPTEAGAPVSASGTGGPPADSAGRPTSTGPVLEGEAEAGPVDSPATVTRLRNGAHDE